MADVPTSDNDDEMEYTIKLKRDGENIENGNDGEVDGDDDGYEYEDYNDEDYFEYEGEVFKENDEAYDDDDGSDDMIDEDFSGEFEEWQDYFENQNLELDEQHDDDDDETSQGDDEDSSNFFNNNKMKNKQKGEDVMNDDDYDEGVDRHRDDVDDNDDVDEEASSSDSSDSFESFELKLPEMTDEISSIEALSGSESSYVIEEVFDLYDEDEVRKQQEEQMKMNQSVDWDNASDFSLDQSFIYEEVSITSFAEESFDGDNLYGEEGELETQPARPKYDDEEEDDDDDDGDNAGALVILGDSTEKFWGRLEELQNMDLAFSKTSGTKGMGRDSRIVWLHGHAGIGKTALARDFLRSAPEAAHVCYGCFEEKSNAVGPFSAVISCFSELASSILSSTDIDIWRERIRKGIGQEARVLAILVPNFAKVLGIKDASSLGYIFGIYYKRLFDRVRLALRKILRVICQYQKVVMVLDDLHWATEESIKLLEIFLSTGSLSNFFFIGCHRGIKPTHMLQSLKSKLEPFTAYDIQLGRIGDEEATDIFFGQLQISTPKKQRDERLVQLAEIINEDAGGSPFMFVHLIKSLQERQILRRKGKSWKWNIEAFEAANLPKDFVDLVAKRIDRVQQNLKLALKSAGLLGLRSFRVEFLFAAVNACFRNHGNADRKCPIDSIETLSKLLSENLGNLILEQGKDGRYEFAHDNVRKAALSLLPTVKKKKARFHYRLGSELVKLLVQGNFPDGSVVKEELRLLIVEHFSNALEIIQEEKEKVVLAKLSIEIAETAMTKMSFASAIKRLEFGFSLLDKKKIWTDFYSVAIRGHVTLAQLKWATGQTDEARILADKAVKRAETARDKIGAYEVLMMVALEQKDVNEAFRLNLLALKEIWNEVPTKAVEEEVARVRFLLHGKTDQQMLSLPTMTHNKTRSKMVFLTYMAEISALRQDLFHQDVAALRMTQLTLRYGVSRSLPLAFSLCGVCLSRRRLQGEANRLAFLSMKLSQPESTYGGQAVAYNHWAIRPWTGPPDISLKPLSNASNAAMEANDMEHVSFRVGAYMSILFISGVPLDTGDDLFKRFQDHAIAFNAKDAWIAMEPYMTILHLRDEVNNKLVSERLSPSISNVSRALEYQNFFQLAKSIFFYDMETAEKISEKLMLKPEGPWVPYRAFMDGLTATYFSKSNISRIRYKYQKRAGKIIEMLSVWARKGFKLCFHMADILHAELRIACNSTITPSKASALYTFALDKTEEVGFIQHEALISERAGYYFLSRNEEKYASRYLSYSCKMYEKWKAFKKVNDLKSNYGKYLNLTLDRPRGVINRSRRTAAAAVSSSKQNQQRNRPVAKRSNQQQPIPRNSSRNLSLSQHMPRHSNRNVLSSSQHIPRHSNRNVLASSRRSSTGNSSRDMLGTSSHSLQGGGGGRPGRQPRPYRGQGRGGGRGRGRSRGRSQQGRGRGRGRGRSNPRGGRGRGPGRGASSRGGGRGRRGGGGGGGGSGSGGGGRNSDNSRPNMPVKRHSFSTSMLRGKKAESAGGGEEKTPKRGVKASFSWGGKNRKNNVDSSSTKQRSGSFRSLQGGKGTNESSPATTRESRKGGRRFGVPQSLSFRLGSKKKPTRQKSSDSIPLAVTKEVQNEDDKAENVVVYDKASTNAATSETPATVEDNTKGVAETVDVTTTSNFENPSRDDEVHDGVTDEFAPDEYYETEVALVAEASTDDDGGGGTEDEFAEDAVYEDGEYYGEEEEGGPPQESFEMDESAMTSGEFASNEFTADGTNDTSDDGDVNDDENNVIAGGEATTTKKTKKKKKDKKEKKEKKPTKKKKDKMKKDSKKKAKSDDGNQSGDPNNNSTTDDPNDMSNDHHDDDDDMDQYTQLSLSQRLPSSIKKKKKKKKKQKKTNKKTNNNEDDNNDNDNNE